MLSGNGSVTKGSDVNLMLEYMNILSGVLGSMVLSSWENLYNTAVWTTGGAEGWQTS